MTIIRYRIEVKIRLRASFTPASPSARLCNLLPFPGRQPLSPGLAAHAAQGDGRGVFAVLGRHVLDFPRRNLGDHDGTGVDAGGAVLTLGTFRHSILLCLAASIY